MPKKAQLPDRDTTYREFRECLAMPSGGATRWFDWRAANGGVKARHDLSNGDLRDTKIEGFFLDCCDLSRCSFSRTTLRKCSLADASLKNTNLTSARLERCYIGGLDRVGAITDGYQEIDCRHDDGQPLGSVGQYTAVAQDPWCTYFEPTRATADLPDGWRGRRGGG